MVEPNELKTLTHLHAVVVQELLQELCGSVFLCENAVAPGSACIVPLSKEKKTPEV